MAKIKTPTSTPPKNKTVGGVFMWDENRSEFHGADGTFSEKHNETNSVDIKSSDEFIKNGIDNHFPNKMEDVAKQSTLQLRALRTIASIANGPIYWRNADGTIADDKVAEQNRMTYELLKLTPSNILGKVAYCNYIQGGSFLTMEWASSGVSLELARICFREYKTARLSNPIYKDGEIFHKDHFYHKNWGHNHQRRNRKVSVGRSNTVSWKEFNSNPEGNKDNVVRVPAFDLDLSLQKPVNRMQSYLMQEQFSPSDYYPVPPWFSATTYNYLQSEFLLSAYDVDDIKNGFNANGIVKLYHEDYMDRSSLEAVQTFDDQMKLVKQKLTGAQNSGSYVVIPYGVNPDGQSMPVNGSIEYEEFKTTADKDRHINFDKRIISKIMSANGIIMPELVGIRDETSTLSESGDKLINAAKLLNSYTIKPQNQIVEKFLNEVVNPLLGIEQKAYILPNLKNIINLSPELAMHFLHPEQFYDMYADLGLSRPTMEQINSQLIPAYKNGTNGVM